MNESEMKEVIEDIKSAVFVNSKSEYESEDVTAIRN